MDSLTEIWKPIAGFEGLYEVSNFGKVKALERKVLNNGGWQRKHERILKPSGDDKNIVALCKEGKVYGRSVYRLVAETFIPNPDNKPVVDHIDTDRTNNHVDNLRWCTQKENCLNPLTREHNSKSKMGHRGYLTHHTEETKQKLREMMTGKTATEETRKKLSESHKNSVKCQAQMKRLAEQRTGTHWRMEGGKRVWY